MLTASQQDRVDELQDRLRTIHRDMRAEIQAGRAYGVKYSALQAAAHPIRVELNELDPPRETHAPNNGESEGDYLRREARERGGRVARREAR